MKQSYAAEVGGTAIQLTIHAKGWCAASETVAEALTWHLGLFIEEQRLEQQRKQLTRVEERNKLARDLHDSVNQLLFSLSLTAKGLEARTADQNVRGGLAYIQELSAEALKELKQLIRQLRPEELENGMTKAIERYAELLELEAYVTIEGLMDIAEKQEECIWRVLQEAMNNTKKHANVDKVNILLAFDKTETRFKIEDKGCGFSQTSRQPDSFGLVGMKERIEEHGGELIIESVPGRGTVIKGTMRDR